MSYNLLTPHQPQFNHRFNLLLFWLLVLATIFILIGICKAKEYTDGEIATAIWHSEGGSQAKSPFGILSVKCEGYDDCRQVCLNTIRNNRKRYSDYGYKQFKTYLEFLGSRYCPTQGKNLTKQEKNVNIYWLKNVKYFLEKKN